MNIICSLVRPRRNYNNFYWLKWRREQVLIEIVSCLHSRCAINQAQRTFITFIIPTVPTENYFRCKKQFFTSPAAHPAVAKLICPQFDTRLKFIFLRKKNYFESVCWRLLRTWKVTSWLFIHSLKLRNHSTMSQLWMTRSKSCFVTTYLCSGEKAITNLLDNLKKLILLLPFNIDVFCCLKDHHHSLYRILIPSIAGIKYQPSPLLNARRIEYQRMFH